ncbi:MAG: formylglycine-generating enzyme family protein [Kiritimatiellae bacterium]|nr:formylglycine-generating enzyme family protein [Kiritimatiellia bacterium]
MKNHIAFAAAVASMSVFAGTPVVSDVQMVQSGNRLVRVTYRLDAPAIVTFDVQTNGSSIGAVNLTNAVGDVSRRIDRVGETCTIEWQPRKSWPGMEAENAKAVVTAWSLQAPPDYMVVSMTSLSNVVFYASADAVPGGVTNDAYKTDKLVMRRIHAAGNRFQMGSRIGESGRTASYEVPHDVVFTNDYYIGIYELTQKQLKNVVGNAPSFFYGKDNWEKRPAEKIYYALMRGSATINKWSSLNPSHEVDMSDGYYLGAFRRFTGLELDLPTEAQWEIACRAGTATAYNDGTDSMDAVGWNNANWSNDPNCTSNETHVVGLLKPNAWGLYDMHGNVGEMCLDWFSKGVYFSDGTEAVEPPGSDMSRESGDGVNYRVVRGGNWNAAAADARSSSKGFKTFWAGGAAKTLGARLCCPVQFPY